MPILRCVISGSAISLTKEIANSGEGTVWETSRADRVAKLYHDPTPERFNKLKIMIAHPPVDPMRERNHVTFAWPQDILKDASGKLVGFIMPKVGDSVPLSSIYNPRLRSRKAPRFNWHYLHTTALNFSLAVQSLHREGYVIGDIKPQNILVNKNALISIIDTDSFQVRDPYSRIVYRCLVGSEGFTPAELLGQELGKVDQTEIHDRFRLGVIIYLLLFGDHPFKGKWMARGESPLPTELIRHGYWPYAQRSLIKPGPTTIPLNIVHRTLQTSFHDCFTKGHSDSRLRPAAGDWVAALSSAVKDLKACHLEKNHLFSQSYGRCYWCERKAKLGLDIFNPDLKQKIDRAKKIKDAQRKRALRPQVSPGNFNHAPRPVAASRNPTIKAPSGLVLGRIRQQISTLPPTLIGSLLCISSLFGLGILLLPELDFNRAGSLSDRFESTLQRVFQMGESQYSGSDSSALMAKELADQGLSHADTITKVSLSPDSQYVASGSRDMNVKVWKLESGQFLRSLSEHFEPINFVQFANNGSEILSSSQSGNVVVWNFPQGTVQKNLNKANETGGGSLRNATLDPKGRFLVSNGWSGGILIHNLWTNKLKRIETNTLASEQALLALPNSNGALLSTSSSGQINVWDLKTGQSRYSFPGVGEWQPIEPVRVMISDRAGKLLVTGNWSGTINLWDVDRGVITQSLNGHGKYVSAMTISPNGKWLATGGGDNVIKLWNLKTGRMAKTLTGHRDDITALEFSANNQHLVSGSRDKTVKVWNAPFLEAPLTLIQK